MLTLISSIDQLMKNIDTIDCWIRDGSAYERDYAEGLIKRGTCFVVRNEGDSWRFYPSRFIGYADNTIEKHNNSEIDGRDTSRVIGKLLKQKKRPDDTLDAEYCGFCASLGFDANKTGAFGAKRKFWMLDK